MTCKNQINESERFAAFIGVDWADRRHHVWMRDAETGKCSTAVLEHNPEALAEWLGGLQARYPGQKVAICLEQSRGALIYALMSYEFVVLYPINPKSLARYREAFAPSGAKDDPNDAELLGEILYMHRDRLKAWKPDDEQTRLIGLLNEGRRKAVNLRTKLVARLRATLKNYFPLAVDLLGEDLGSRLACDLLVKWPTLEDLQKAKPQTLRKFFYAHNSRQESLIQERLERIRQAKPLTSDEAIIRSSCLTVKMLVKQLRPLDDSIKEYDQQLAEFFAAHPDAEIFGSFPGAGKALGPRLVSAFGSDRNRYEKATEIQNYSGVAPVLQRSGESSWTHWRWSCPKFLRQTFHEHAKCSIPQSLWAKAYYQMERNRGKGHHAAIRALAFKWIRIMFRCWQDRTPYDEQRYLNSIKRGNSELWQYICKLPATV